MTVIINPGRGLMNKASQPSSRTINWDVHLTTLAESFSQDMMNFVGSRVFPMVPVEKESDRYWVYPIGTFSRHHMEDREEMGIAPRANFTLSDNTFQCRFKSLAHEVSDRRRANSRAPLMEDEAVTKFLVENALIDIELGFADTYFKAGVWDYQATGSTTAANLTNWKRATGRTIVQWDDYENSTPLRDVTQLLTAVGEATGRRPNVATFGRPVFDALKHHPEFVGRIDDGQTNGVAMVTRANMAALLEVDEVLVMDSVQNSVAEGFKTDGSPKDAVNQFIGGKHALFSYRASASPSFQDGSAGYTFVFRNADFIPNAFGMFNDQGMGISRYYDRKRRCEAFEIDLAYDQKLSGPSLGCFLSGIVT